METMLGFAAVTVITTLALFAALALEGALLHGMLRLMQPATANRRQATLQVACGTRLAARAFGSRS